MGHYINAKYSKMYKKAYEMGLIEELRELHPVRPSNKNYRIWKGTIELEMWLIKKIRNKGKYYINNHDKLSKLSDDEIVDLIRNISIFFTYIYDDDSHNLNKEYMKKFDALSNIYKLDTVRPFMNVDMLSVTIQSILLGDSLEKNGNEWIMNDYAFHGTFWVDSQNPFHQMKKNEGFFTMTLIIDSFSINWPRNNPLIAKK